MSDDLSDFSMEELFRAEAEGQCRELSQGLLAVEKAGDPAVLLENLMRSAHSLKGAARIIGLDQAVHVAHAMEDCFVQAQKRNVAPDAATVDVLLRGVDLLSRLAGVTPGEVTPSDVQRFVLACENPSAAPVEARSTPVPEAPREVPKEPAKEVPKSEPRGESRRDIRIDADRLDSLVGLAGQAVVAAQVEHKELLAARGVLRQMQALLSQAQGMNHEARRGALLTQALALAAQGQSTLVEDYERKDLQSRRMGTLCNRIYNEALACRLRPFGDITAGLHRLTRDLARSLGKEVDLSMSGEDTEVDRDLLDRLDGPLSHLIRNALDHGLETPDERAAAGKARGGTLAISARHHAGWLVISVSDDGRGLNFTAIKEVIVSRGLASAEHVGEMHESELLEFLLLPGFSLRKQVTEVSGRGVGLDAVRAMAYGSGGRLRLARSEQGGFLCEIILPVSLSLVRALVTEISGDFFAFPLTRVDRVLEVQPTDIHAAAGRQHVFIGEERVEVLSAAQALELESSSSDTIGTSLIIVQGPQGRLGLAVDRFVGQKELSIQRLDPRLGQMQDVSATALLETGDPVVLLDVNDLAITATNFSSGSRYRPLAMDAGKQKTNIRRILVADDSLTVRELERKLLAGHGYMVETAIDGSDAWNALRGGSYDLLVTDIDMPRMDGIELTKLVRNDARLRDLPIVIVSYKDRDEDKSRGLEAGADFYLPKSSYQDESLLRAVQELIGDPVVVL